MRNLVLALLFANLLYFFWNRWVGEAPPVDPGIDIVDPGELAPRAELAPAPAVGAAEPVLPACISFGQFDEREAADARLEELTGEGYSAAIRSATGEVFIGHWVQVVDIEGRAAANALVARLTEGGMEEAYVVGDDAEGYTISLGLFSELERAERVELQAKAIGIDAVVGDRTREAEVFWVDVTSPDAALAAAGQPCPGGD